MYSHELNQRISKFVFLIDRLKYGKGRYLYAVLFFIILISVSAVMGTYFYQKSVITKKENILKSYFEQKGSNSFDLVNPGSAAMDIPKSDAGNISDSSQTKSGIAADILPGGKATEEDNGVLLAENKQLIKVYICGCVKNPGVYELAEGSRVVDLEELCGGFTEDACIEAVNLAAILSDAQKIYIPSETEVSQQGINLYKDMLTAGSTDGNKDSKDSGSDTLIKKININFASSEELISLPGIGEQIAKNIIDYRNQYGAFNVKEDLKNVKGIGEKKFEQIKDLISV